MVNNVATSARVASLGPGPDIEPITPIPTSEITNAGLKNKELMTPSSPQNTSTGGVLTEEELLDQFQPQNQIPYLMRQQQGQFDPPGLI